MSGPLTVVFLASAGLLAAPEKPEERELELLIYGGYGGTAPLRAWIPAWVRIRAAREGFEGQLEVRSRPGGVVPASMVRRPLEVIHVVEDNAGQAPPVLDGVVRVALEGISR